MTHLGISFVSGLSTLQKYLNVSRLRLIRNTQALNALAVVKLLRKPYPLERTYVRADVSWIEMKTQLEISLVGDWVR
jgi:hypothetical protein